MIGCVRLTIITVLAILPHLYLPLHISTKIYGFLGIIFSGDQEELRCSPGSLLGEEDDSQGQPGSRQEDHCLEGDGHQLRSGESVKY